MTPLIALKNAFSRAESIRPLAGGFPYLCAALHEVGVVGYTVDFPSTNKAFRMVHEGRIITLTMPGEPIVAGPSITPQWDIQRLLQVINADKAHHAPGDLPALMANLYGAGTLRYEVSIGIKLVTCQYWGGGSGETYVEEFDAVTLD